jgi:hypothetical protein
VEIQIHHLSGSKAGLEQTFSSGPIRIGREQSNDIVFDPYRDILVSGRHAEITFDGRQWVLRDLGSSNGTYVGDERITVRPLASGETIQFGRGGPRLQLRIQSEVPAPVPIPTRTSAAVDNPGTRVMSIDDLVAGNHTSGGNMPRPQAPAAAEGTMMMSAGDYQSARAQATPAAAGRRTSSPLRIVLLVAALAFFIGIMGLILLKPSSKPAAPAPAPANAEVEKLKQELAAREAQLAELQKLRSQSTETGGVVTQDLERQYVSQQSTIDALRQELERKNDEVVAAASKPPQVVVKYVPVPQPRQEQAQAQLAPPPAQPPMQTQTYAPQPEPQPVQTVPYVAPSAPARAVAGNDGVRPAPTRAVAEPPQVASQPSQRPTPQPAAVASRPAPPPAPEAAPLRLANLKRLRRRVIVNGVTSEIPFPDAPRNLPTELAKSIGVALTSSSEYYVDRTAGPTVRITPTLFRSVAKKSDSGNVVNKAKGLSSIFGGPLSSVKVPVRAQSVSYDAALSAQVTVESANGRVLARSTPSSSLVDRRSSVAVVPAKTTFGDLLNTDTPQSDVIRNVVGLAVDDIMRALATADAEISVKSAKGQVVTLDAGRNANVAPDDVFDIIDGDRAIARVRVDSVQDGTSVARLISGETALAGKRARYAGTDITNDASAIPQLSTRSAVVRAQTEAREAPGASFKTVAVLKPGVRATYLYSVGSWSKVTNGDAPMWVLTNTIEVN